MSEKACSRCGEVKPLSMYYVNGNGRHSICKTCNNEHKSKYIKRHPLRYKARATVNNALARGEICRSPCELCGNQSSEAHHDDYTKPLSIRWLCRKHHLEWHKSNEAIE